MRVLAEFAVIKPANVQMQGRIANLPYRIWSFFKLKIQCDICNLQNCVKGYAWTLHEEKHLSKRWHTYRMFSELDSQDGIETIFTRCDHLHCNEPPLGSQHYERQHHNVKCVFGSFGIGFNPAIDTTFAGILLRNASPMRRPWSLAS